MFINNTRNLFKLLTGICRQVFSVLPDYMDESFVNCALALAVTHFYIFVCLL